ncbi:uncharacterized protein LOC121718991 [Alosa sapidissima]|uniref:uncharacterized protein LOC121718991 n=1 Tax=Alosa sapidissima TaxID=34773 RepID=UPI001C085016|nr:uncharacterized protein LOC121718991 [Alosa sapidissima]
MNSVILHFSAHSATVSIRLLDLTVDNVARIFQLVPDTIYLKDRENGTLVLPYNGIFTNTVGAEYDVEGRPSTEAGPQFRFPPGRLPAAGPAPGPRPPRPSPSPATYTRNVVVATLVDGAWEEASLTVRFSADQATVQGIQDLVRAALDARSVVLADGQGRRLIPSAGTEGLEYWRRGSRKVVAYRGEDFPNKRSGRRSTTEMVRAEVARVQQER